MWATVRVIRQRGWSFDDEEHALGTRCVASPIYDEHGDRFHVFDRARAETPLLPASTFKVFNAMVALDSGAVKDEYEVIHWDGVKRQFDGWNRDHCLASAMKFSAVWFYQEMARRAGQTPKATPRRSTAP